MRPWALHSGRSLYETWGHLSQSVETGDTAFDHLHGMNVWEHRKRNVEVGRIFHDAMAANTAVIARSVASAFNFSRFGTVVDVGGGKGTLLLAILSANPKLKGVLFDVEAAVQEAGSLFASAGLADRYRSVAGDFFESVPTMGDAYILSRILHDWHDEQAMSILRTVGRAMAGNGRLLIVERVLDAQNPGIEPTHSDINMLMMTGGLERTAIEFRALLAAAGFELAEVIPTDSPVRIIEASPA